MRIIERYDVGNARYPISVGTVVAHLRVGDVDSNELELIKLKLTAAISIAERYVNRVIEPAKAIYAINPSHNVIELKSASSIEKIEYLNDKMEWAILDNTKYHSTTTSTGINLLINNVPKDITAANVIERCRVIAEVGYDNKTIPKGIVAAVLLLTGTLYDNESDEIVGRSVSSLSTTAEKILLNYRIRP